MNYKGIFKTWLPLAVLSTAFCALAYAAVQQSLRQAADDPQIRMAEDAAAALNEGASIDSVVPQKKVDMGKSLAPFMVIYDKEGRPVTGSGLLDRQLPEYPKGALESAGQSGQNRVTWQPDPAVRIASVVVPYKEGYVLAGRSLREVERRELQTGQFAGATWALSLIATFIFVWFGESFLAEKK